MFESYFAGLCEAAEVVVDKQGGHSESASSLFEVIIAITYYHSNELWGPRCGVIEAER